MIRLLPEGRDTASLIHNEKIGDFRTSRLTVHTDYTVFNYMFIYFRTLECSLFNMNIIFRQFIIL